MSKTEWENNEEIKIFREYLRIPSVHPNIDYSKFSILITFSIMFRSRYEQNHKPFNTKKITYFCSWLRGILETTSSQLGSARRCCVPSERSQSRGDY